MRKEFLNHSLVAEAGRPSAPRDLHWLELTEIAALLQAGAISSRQVTEAHLERIAACDGKLRAYVLVMAASALEQADRADAERAAGLYRGPLHGVPLAVKDLFWIKGHATTAGMPALRDFVPDEDATVVTRLKKAGAVLLGKTQMTEGAYSDHHPSITPPRNPWNTDYWPGISSSGSGVATAAGLCYGALASDTGGSIRWPSAANGVTGLKPTWGRISRHGAVELAASLDHVGVMARSAADVAVLYEAIAGSDPNDPTSRLEAVAAYGETSVRGLRLGIDPVWNSEDVNAETQKVLADAIALFTHLGAEIVEVRFPDVTQAVADWVPNCAVEAAVAHGAIYDSHRADYGPVLASVIEAGRALSATAYQQILLRRAAFRGQVDRLFETIDLLLTPVQPFPPLTWAAIKTLGAQPELIARLQRYTCPFDMTGHPALTLPGGLSGTGMPIGFQLVAGQLGEPVLMRAGLAFQSATAWHRRHPVL